VVPGECVEETSDGALAYHYYPDAASVRSWVSGAGLERLDERVGDEYQHLLARRPG
jgi:hypothetical protein